MGEDRRVDSQACAGGTQYSTTSFGRFVLRYRRNADMRALTSLCWLLRSSAGKKRIIMVFYSRLVIIWEQHDEQTPWLAKRAHQTLDETGIFSPNHRHTFRSDSQPYRSGCRKCIASSAIDRDESTDYTTTATHPDRIRLVFLSHFTLIVFAWCFYRTLRSSGNKLYILFNRILCYAGIVSCFNSIGGGNRKASQRFRLKRSH